MWVGGGSAKIPGEGNLHPPPPHVLVDATRHRWRNGNSGPKQRLGGPSLKEREGKGSEWRSASGRRQLQTRTQYHGFLPTPPPPPQYHSAMPWAQPWSQACGSSSDCAPCTTCRVLVKSAAAEASSCCCHRLGGLWFSFATGSPQATWFGEEPEFARLCVPPSQSVLVAIACS